MKALISVIRMSVIKMRDLISVIKMRDPMSVIKMRNLISVIRMSVIKMRNLEKQTFNRSHWNGRYNKYKKLVIYVVIKRYNFAFL